MSTTDNFKNNPAFSGINPLKLVFLEQILGEMQKQSKDTMIPFFLAVNTKASQMGIQFTDEETNLIYSEMEKKMTSEEKKRFQMIRSMMQKKKES